MISYNDPPKCPRCNNQMKRARIEIWGNEEDKPNAWTCHIKGCPVNTITWEEGQKNTFENWLKRRYK